MNVAGVEIEGLDKLTTKLGELPRKVEGQVARPALRAGAKVIQAAVVAKARRRTGLMARTIKVRAMKRSRTRVAGVMVTTSESSFAPKGKAFYAWFQERGWHVGKRTAALRRAYEKAKKTKQPVNDTRKFVEGTHFMQQGFDEAKDQAAEVIERELAKGIEEALRG